MMASEELCMITVISRLRVPDYKRWADQFEAGAKSRNDFGIEVLAYGYDTSDDSIAIVVLRLESEEKGMLLLKNPVLQSNLEKEGIQQIDLTVVKR
jgi:hypothetical protein